jgi:hypothetical protein
MSKPIYEFQFTRKNLPYYVDVHAETVTEAVAKANTIGHDFLLIPEGGDSENDIPEFTKEDICYIYELGGGGRGEIGSIDKLPEEARK